MIEADERSKQGQKGEIIAKLNALVDTEVIDTLYEPAKRREDSF